MKKEETQGIEYDRSFLNVGTRIEGGPSFAFAAGTTERLTQEQLDATKMTLEGLLVVEDPNAIDG